MAGAIAPAAAAGLQVPRVRVRVACVCAMALLAALLEAGGAVQRPWQVVQALLALLILPAAALLLDCCGLGCGWLGLAHLHCCLQASPVRPPSAERQRGVGWGGGVGGWGVGSEQQLLLLVPRPPRAAGLGAPTSLGATRLDRVMRFSGGMPDLTAPIMTRVSALGTSLMVPRSHPVAMVAGSAETGVGAAIWERAYQPWGPTAVFDTPRDGGEERRSWLYSRGDRVGVDGRGSSKGRRWQGGVGAAAAAAVTARLMSPW